MSVVLIGYRGSGKSTIGKRLADQLWQPFVDTDLMIVKEAGKSIADIFAQEGEPHFRDLETQALTLAMTLQEHVISLGGGAVVREANRKIIAQSGHRVIYLRCDPAVLASRISADPGTASSRPALSAAASPVDEVSQVLAVREPLYRQCCHVELDVTNLTVDDAVVHIVRRL